MATEVLKDQTAEHVAEAFRRWGYLEADLDPLGRLVPEHHPELPEKGEEAERFRRIYCGSIGVEFMHIPDPERRRWIREKMESDSEGVDADRILDLLIRVDMLEQLLQTRYLGTKRFSIKGVDALVPLLSEMLDEAAGFDAERAILAMSHRGRLNVMIHIVGRPAEEIFAGFEDVDPKSTLGGGDVKYHLGATGTFKSRRGPELAIHLVSNPSHLEAVDPVALGRVKARQVRRGDEGHRAILPILMHGDAAFAGQGMVAEVLNLSNLPGFAVGGAIHIIVNNLIGFTATPDELHSSRFASDVAKRLPVPIIHVNGEDLEAVLRAGRLALQYRYEFGTDVVVDLIGYRMYGHSEVDDPTITQPLLYEKIKNRPPLWESFAKRAGVSSKDLEPRISEIKSELESAIGQAKERTRRPIMRQLPSYWDDYFGGRYRGDFEVDTALSRDKVRELAERLLTLPEDFHVHPKVQRLLDQRREMAQGERAIDFGMAEALAFASVVEEGYSVRLTGQDSRRGTFNQRHSYLVDVETGEEYCSLQHIAGNQGRFTALDSMLSEAAVLGFEYGYSRDFPEALVLWEAQFGDFANGGQVIIDQFITAAEDKWELLSGLVVLLPHGYEGQGPEHSSARIERFLQLAARDNVQVAQPSTAAQYFHLLRRQILRKWRKPLIVFTPKSMLRHPSASSSLEEFESARFRRVRSGTDVEDARRILLCTGKIGHELEKERRDREDASTDIVFIEQLYPFPEAELREVFDRHPRATEVVWVQEEPANMGALFFVEPSIRRLGAHLHFRSVKRSATGTPATGSAKAHQVEQKTLLTLAFARLGP